jgi:DNA mismatch repair ATPase MutS
MNSYKNLYDHFLLLQKATQKKVRQLGYLRLLAALLVIFGIYIIIKFGHYSAWIFILVGFIAFVFLVKKQKALTSLERYYGARVNICSKEIRFLDGQKNIFDGGPSFLTENHNYSLDLDIFGSNSLFGHLNRTHTIQGAQILAQYLSSASEMDVINKRQQAVKELTPQSEWRQHLEAYAQLVNDTSENNRSIKSWITLSTGSLSTILRIASFLLPILLAASISAYILSSNFLLIRIAIFIFLLQLSVVGFKLKEILNEVSLFDKIKDTLHHYIPLFDELEKHPFQAEILTGLQSKLKGENDFASKNIEKLSVLVNNLSSIQNLGGATIFNGLTCYHLHQYSTYLKWKKMHHTKLNTWLEAIAEWETLHSLAQFSYNNPEFAFPEFDKDKIDFENMAHPLLPANRRISNCISYNKSGTIILTGSNMSGKSTFLRTVGVNLVLANCGSVVAATAAKFQPRQILVSMRLDDSLADSQSYFFAEINRIKMIVEKMNQQSSFIILDEILRGTNSDDKRNGTVELLKKLMNQHATGIIATHDTEVCQLTFQYSEYFRNKCFEVEIKENDLYFDYVLRDGICQNKSATFLMKKVGIID